MSSPHRLSWFARAYVGVVVCAGSAAIVDAVGRLGREPLGYEWLVLAVLTWISGTFAIRVPGAAATISVSETFIFTQVLLFGSAPAIVTVALDGLFTSLFRRNLLARRLLFNIAEPAVSVFVAAWLFSLASGRPALFYAPAGLGDLVLPVTVLTVGYLVMNGWLTAAAVGLEAGVSPVAIWRAHGLWLSLNFFGGASIALLLALNMREFSLQGFGVVLPLLVVLYVAFRSWSGRIEDADRHIRTLNRLYLSTVEALSTAIESKDQVTHGHVRRVQILTMAVARALGVTGADELKAIEAASLLHDMGKVAIPDHILQKPGKFTDAEYERMKLHAPIGAHILSTVDFPYPVAPIVRHHHERWDGRGYPDGIAGEEIPLGARILSVVDCYDALTSDRPYRRAMTQAEALDLIQQDCGKAYDPRVVAAFADVLPGIRLDTVAMPNEHVLALIEQANAPLAPAPARMLPAVRATREARRLLESAAPVAADGLLPAIALAPTAAALRELIPASLVVVYGYDEAADTLRAVHVSGHGDLLAGGLTIPLGVGLSGWVAAHRKPILNSDPALDFGTALDGLVPRLASTLSVPIVEGTPLGGVLTIYSVETRAFGPDAVSIAEHAAAGLAGYLAGRSFPAPGEMVAGRAAHRQPDAGAEPAIRRTG